MTSGASAVGICANIRHNAWFDLVFVRRRILENSRRYSGTVCRAASVHLLVGSDFAYMEDPSSDL